MSTHLYIPQLAFVYVYHLNCLAFTFRCRFPFTLPQFNAPIENVLKITVIEIDIGTVELLLICRSLFSSFFTSFFLFVLQCQ